jgi:hypothetical protein
MRCFFGFKRVVSLYSGSSRIKSKSCGI